MGSLTGAVASKKVTEASKGRLSTVRNRARSVRAISLPNCEADEPSRDESRA